MNISIIPADKTIVINGQALIFDFVLWSSKIHAIQWNGSSGTIEYKTGAATWFDNIALIDPYIEAYYAEAARLAEIEAAAQAAAAAQQQPA